MEKCLLQREINPRRYAAKKYRVTYDLLFAFHLQQGCPSVELMRKYF